MTIGAMKSDAEINDQAIDWLLRLGGDGDDGDRAATRAALAAWLEADPRHRAAFTLAQATWTDLAQMKAVEPVAAMARRDVEALAARPRGVLAAVGDGVRAAVARPVAAMGAVAGLCLLAIAMGVLVDGADTVAPPDTVHATRTAEIRDVALPDGSMVTLGAETAIEVRFSDRQRHIAMAGGEAFFAVEPDAARPFAVAVGDTVVRVVGTRFDIRQHADQVTVAVMEGRVELVAARQAHEPAPVVLSRGQTATATPAGLAAPVAEIDPEAPGAWRSGRLVFDDAPLADVIADANRYYDGRITLASADMGALRITTSFRAGQVDQMLEGLRHALPVELERRGRTVTLVHRPD